MKNKNYIKQKGFTLVELLVVITIIATMAALIMPKLTGQAEKARVAEAMGILSAMRRGQEVRFNDRGEYATVATTVATGNTTSGADPITPQWAVIGMSPPSNTLYWTFLAIGGRPSDAGRTITGAGGNILAPPGAAVAIRTSVSAVGTAGDALVLAPDGTWSGTGKFSQGPPRGAYAPQR